MLPSDFQDILACVPQAVARLGPDLRVEWLEPDFGAKTGMVLQVGDPVLSALEGGWGRDALERALREGRAHSGWFRQGRRCEDCKPRFASRPR